jgi:signal transduction histidine kinase
MFLKRFRGKLTVAFGMVLLLALANAALSYWGAEQSRFHLERSRLAHEVLGLHQQLSTKTVKLFKQTTDMIVLGEAADVFDEVAARQQLDATLRRLRKSIEAEMDFVAEAERRQEEIELSDVDVIEEMTEQILADLKSVQELVKRGEPQLALMKLSHILENKIDGEISVMINHAIAEEEAEKEQAYATADNVLRRVTTLASFFAIFSLVFVAMSIVGITRQLRRPIYELVAGTRELSRGNLSYRIPPLSDLDFREVAEGFNQMASSLQATARTQADMNSSLEALVRERTESLEAANTALASRDRERLKFLADLSHELRTPLTIIRGEADVALRASTRASPGHRLALERVAQQATLLSRLVDDLLFMARADSGHPRIDSEAVDLLPLLRSVCVSVGVLASEKDIAVLLPEPASNVVVSGDTDRLRQLFTILLDNAVRYGRQGGRAEVSIGTEGEKVTVCVSDNGVGIRSVDLDRVFERFYRGENAVTLSPNGSGLGLPVALAIVNAHGGTIAIESDLGRGTQVSVMLLAVLADEEPQDEASSD